LRYYAERFKVLHFSFEMQLLTKRALHYTCILRI